jgi:hypothetical protein
MTQAEKQTSETSRPRRSEAGNRRGPLVAASLLGPSGAAAIDVKRRASRRKPAERWATVLTRATYFSVEGAAIWERALNRMAAVAESAATIRWREDPKAANAMSGSRTV